MSIEDLQTHAIPFLALLDQCSEQEAWHRKQTWQTADDDRNRRDPTLTAMFHGPLSAVASKLITLNEAGAGIYVAVNRTDLRGRAKRNIVVIRAWHADIDKKLQDEPHDPTRLPLPPSIIVKSGGGGYHDYWLPRTVMDCDGDETRRAEHEAEVRGIQVALGPFGSDSSAVDISRPLRLPGTVNQKPDCGVLATLHLITSHRYDRQQIIEAFPPARALQVGRAVTSTSILLANPQALARARGYLGQIEGAVQGQGGSTHTLNTAMKLFSKFGLDRQTVLDLMRDQFNPTCVPPWEEQDLERKVVQAEGKAQAMPLDPRPFPASRPR